MMGSLEPQTLRIFIVENHVDTLKYLRMLLEGLGHTVITAIDMTQALEVLPRADCDVLISDISLPDGNGWDLLKRAQLPHPIYAIAMSGLGLNADRARSKAAGFRHHLIKPFDIAELESFLAEAANERAA